MLAKIIFFACLHEDTNSLRLFKVANSGLHIIKYFSHRQRGYFIHLYINTLGFCCSHKANLSDECHILWYETNSNKDA